MDDINELIRQIIECAYTVREHLKAGYVESIYKNAMFIELRQAGIPVSTEVPFHVDYHGKNFGEFRADMVVDGRVILELKAVEHLVKAHEVQLVNYLTITGITDGLLINFGRLEDLEIKRKFRIYRAKGSVGVFRT